MDYEEKYNKLFNAAFATRKGQITYFADIGNQTKLNRSKELEKILDIELGLKPKEPRDQLTLF